VAIVLDGTAGEQLSGNLTFTSTGQRITGDFSNATQINRVAFQSNTTNGNTDIAAIPNGTATQSVVRVLNGSDLTSGVNSIGLFSTATEGSIRAAFYGTNTPATPYLPMTFYTSNTSQMQIAIDGTITGTKGNLQLISGTAVASTSGTSIDFTGIPSWAKRITVMFNGVSLSGTANPLIQIGSGSVTTTGYLSYATVTDSASAATSNTSGYLIYSNTAAALIYGSMQILLVSGNTYIGSGCMAMGTAARSTTFGGNVSLSGALDRVRITTSNGTDTFDAGSINILYE
jgi:hypothetical protein